MGWGIWYQLYVLVWLSHKPSTYYPHVYWYTVHVCTRFMPVVNMTQLAILCHRPGTQLTQYPTFNILPYL